MKVQIETRRGMLAWIVWSLLAGWGLMNVIEAFVPDRWTPFVIAAIALAGVVWAWRQARWAGRMRKQLEADMTILAMQAEDEDLR